MSASTPENKMKKKIKQLLDTYQFGVIYIYMPVPGGYGESTLDYLGFAKGQGFAIEAKAPGKQPTDLQKATIERILLSGAKVFVINDEASLDTFRVWLEKVLL